MKNCKSRRSDSDNATNTNELDVSGITDAAKILIERMKIKPEEFTPGNKFGHIWAACWQRVNPAPHTGAPPPVPLRDAEVLLAAYDKYITEPEFTKHVLETVFAEPKPEPAQQAYIRPGIGPGIGGLGIGYTDPRGQYGASLTTALGSTGNAAGWGQALTAPDSLRLGQQTLTEDLIAKMKTKLGL